LLAIIRGLEKYHYYLERYSYKIEIWLDYQNLKFFRIAQKLTRKQARWVLYIIHFDYILYHKPGKIIQAENPLKTLYLEEQTIRWD